MDEVALLAEGLPHLEEQSVERLAARLEEEGFRVTKLSAEEILSEDVLTPERFPLYVIPEAQTYPAEGEAALRSYLARKGKLLLVGAPAFTRLLWREKDRWVDAETIHSESERVPQEKILFSFDGDETDLDAWSRGTNDRIHDAGVERVDEGKKGGCLKYWTEDLTGWDTWGSPEIASLYGEGHGLFSFWARGDAQTSELSLEMIEEDGSRWIAVVPLTEAWRFHVVPPSAFHYWGDSKTKAKRGTQGDTFHPEAARRIVIGLANSHTKSVGPGPHAFWMDEMGTSRDPFEKIRDKLGSGFASIETVTPSYKVFELQEIDRLRVDERQRFLEVESRLPVPGKLYSAIARPSGEGFQQGSPWRWIPLVHALDEKGKCRGTPVWLLQFNEFPFQGASLLAVAACGREVLKDEDWLDLIAEGGRILLQENKLAEAGTAQFAIWPGEEMLLGARLFGEDSVSAHLKLSFQVRCANKKRILFKETVSLEEDMHRTEGVRCSWRPPSKAPAVYDVTVRLLKEDRVLDEIGHEAALVEERDPSKESFVQVEGAQFSLAGKPWHPVGINYWPLYVSGQDPEHYWAGWLTPGLYAPDEVERDLERMEALGINMVSIQMDSLECHRNLLDFLRRCEHHHIKVNGFLNGASPLDFDEGTVRTLIEAARLASNPTLFAYDIIWEPGNYVFRGAGRDRWDKEWEDWIVERYGSVERAEKDWAMACPTKEGRPTSPSDFQMREDGDWRIMVAAYRRFMDDLMSRKWNDATRKVRRLDPNHLVSFRQGNTLPQDFTFTATPKHIDFICPEGYSIPHSEEGSNAAGFITRYVHFTSGGKPVLWSEFGKSVWNREAMRPHDALIGIQSDYHELFYRMVLKSGANGTAPWWWPGGYRVNERSDYGIMNMDGTPRPAAELILKYGSLIQKAHPYPSSNTWFVMDRDEHPGGYWHVVFNQGKDAYKEAADNGNLLGVRTEGTRTTSVDTPLLAVGNVPCDGKNPPKYLNAEFNFLKVLSRKGAWEEVPEGGSVDVPSSGQMRCQASVGNLGEAAWIAAEDGKRKKGAVYLVARQGEKERARVSIPKDVPTLSDSLLDPFELEGIDPKYGAICFQLEAYGRTFFGEKWTLRLRGHERSLRDDSLGKPSGVKVDDDNES